MTSGFQSPNHTQVPNDLFEKHLAVMEKSELKVVLAVIRRTLGFHKRKARISVRAIRGMTGLGHDQIYAGAEAAEARGLLKKHLDGGVTEWEIIWNDPPHIGTESVPVAGTPEAEKDQGVPVAGTEALPRQERDVPVAGTPSIKENSKERERKNTSEIEDIGHKTAARQHRSMLMAQDGGLPWQVPEQFKTILTEFAKVWTEVYGRKIMQGDKSRWIKGAKFLHEEFGEGASEYVLEAGKLHRAKKDDNKKRLSLNGPRGLHYMIRELAYADTQTVEPTVTGVRPG